ncbi:CinA family protein [Hansschlegelia zhihuaiae]|uniref:Nicotinamide-nucleotide amidohydrolase family protein n=1 Tax=Hansschlegelia zhihuaiae TaxID=405005 RepID=A0A4Q0MMD8_9HYPH|nr:nicotinamide-nucleotide amidohydrolase family protein [Hansschlegelia zhihuaiae]RXF74743.1 nicotinamide-nucleotide amidohydrolase family protein [Hansschlegelia zhihuaiae]
MAKIHDLAEEVLRLAVGAGLTIVTAESCTGGLVAAAITEIAGSSRAMDRGFVTYSNLAKATVLGVPAELIQAHGAVSEDVARAMVEGALRVSGATLGVAVTGVAGPESSEQKPVGLVHFAAKRKGRPTILREKRFGESLSRAEVRTKSVKVALEMLAEAAGKTSAA